MKLSVIAQKTQGQLFGQDLDVCQFSTDTRTLKAGDVFIALSGANFDANTFVAKAQELGAVAAIVTQYQPDVPLSQIVVGNTQTALGLIAKAWREQFELMRVAMTGSSGKTTTKELTASIFRQAGLTLATLGNKNNEIGVPLTLLRLTAEYHYGVFELGANHIGEIAYTSGLVQPHAAVITNIGTAHLEGFGSRQGIAKAKGEIFGGLVEGGTAVINADDEFADYHRTLCDGKKILNFSIAKPADIYATDIKRSKGGAYQFVLHIAEQSTPIQLGLIGQHNVANALAASCLAVACGLNISQIKQGLEQAQSAAGRMVLHRLPHFTLIDDTYNANPDAMKAAIDELALCEGYKIVVLGAMGELGDDAASLHQQVGAYAQSKQIDALYCVGAFSEHTAQGYGVKAQRFSEQKELIAALLAAIPQGATILVKGSRSARMENVVQALLA
ncbi:MAG: UDP-N-acetylmuramoyl-tripeptide--D-alanyl-D-alanine ligase [Agitococcus sp.]